MFNFLKRKRAKNGEGKKTADTFVEATGGGWSDAPDAIPTDGGEHFNFISEVLRQARLQAYENDVPAGEQFKFVVTDIPTGIESPHIIMFGLMMRAPEEGLSFQHMVDETVTFVRDV